MDAVPHAVPVIRRARKTGQEAMKMNAEYLVTGIVALLLLFYLMYALLRPEKF